LNDRLPGCTFLYGCLSSGLLSSGFLSSGFLSGGLFYSCFLYSRLSGGGFLCCFLCCFLCSLSLLHDCFAYSLLNILFHLLLRRHPGALHAYFCRLGSDRGGVLFDFELQRHPIKGGT